ncbi:hypothetical protein RHGRI_023927 [Rhododendron griersonianum]|uniref:Ribosomal protein L2 n=2 Tax=Rhododendron TaxID=4346 RepID=A0AAV6J939_9ERIC|nr:hypothetical protein RHGRI_023927 [Rhododendron griersonianum]
MERTVTWNKGKHGSGLRFTGGTAVGRNRPWLSSSICNRVSIATAVGTGFYKLNPQPEGRSSFPNRSYRGSAMAVALSSEPHGSELYGFVSVLPGLAGGDVPYCFICARTEARQ